jgi:F-type H+-transporting ATPase subunit gamma
MPSLKEVKNRIQSVSSTQQITKAMKMVAASKLRKAQDRMQQMRPFSQKLTKVMQNISASIDPDQVENLYAEEREVNRVLLVVLTSDRGLCGAFNSNVFKFTRGVIEEKYAHLENTEDLVIMPLGKRSYEYFKKRGYTLVSDYWEIFHHLDFDHALAAANHAMNGFINGDYDRIEIIYNEFKNVATQVLRDEQFLPIAQEEAQVDNKSYASDTDYIYEPNQEFIFTEIVPKSLKIQFYKALLESNAAEHGARMTAMDQATDNAQELLKDLKLTYNRTRQAAITKEILEIVGGAEALAQSS